MVFRLILISGIFRKDDELDILPPPPPFPEIGEDLNPKKTEKKKPALKILEKRNSPKEKPKISGEQGKESKKKVFDFFHNLGLVKTEEEKRQIEKKRLEERKEQEIQKQKALAERKKKEAKEKMRLLATKKQENLEKGTIEKGRNRRDLENRGRKEEALKRKKELKRRNKDLMRKRKQFVLKKGLEFLNKIGVIRTEEQKKEHEKQRKEYRRLREAAKRKLEEEKKKKLELIKKRDALRAEELTKRRFEEEKKQLELRKRQILAMKEANVTKADKSKIPELEKKGVPLFSKIFSEKEDKKAFELELRDLEKIQKPKPEIQKLGKSKEILKAEDEIKKAISAIKKTKKRKFSLGLFKAKKENVERPGVMPRVWEREDHVEIIEERIHKARLMLMDFKFDRAKKIYIDIMGTYNDLEPEKKAKVYQDIKDLYYERKTAEKYAK
jgi:hypothetical protein